MDKYAEILKNVKRIHLVHYCHCDFAWTNSRMWHKKRYIAFFNGILDKFNEGADFKVTVDNTEHALKVFEKYSPERLEEFKQRVREGKICISNGGAALVRPNDSGDELFIRNMLKGKHEFESLFGEENTGKTFLNADTSFGHGQLPQILQNCGYELYRFFRPKHTLDKKGLPREFIYKGIDGSTVYITRGEYASRLENSYKYMDFQKEEEVIDSFISEVIAPEMPLQVSEDLIIFVGGDDVMPLCNPRDEYEKIPELISIWNKHFKDIKMDFSSLDGYLEQIKRQSLPIIEGVIEPCELFYNLPLRGNSGLWKRRYAVDRELISLERLETMAAAMGHNGSPDKISGLWDKLCEFSGHAMNGLLEEDFSRVIANADMTLAAVSQYKNDLAEFICSKISCGRENEYVIFNLNSKEICGNVQLNICAPSNITGFQLLDNDGKKIPYQITDFNLGDKEFTGCDFSEIQAVCRMSVPAMSAVCISVEFDGSSALQKAENDIKSLSGDFTVNNGYMELQFKDGMITSVTEASSGKEIYSYNGEHNFADIRLYNTKIGNSWYLLNEETTEYYRPESCILKADGPLRHTVITEGAIGAHKIRQTITLEKESPRIDFKTEIRVASGGIEGYFNVAFPSDGGSIFAGIPFGQEKREPESEVYSSKESLMQGDYLMFERSGENVFWGKHFVSFENNDTALSILQGDCSIYYRKQEKACELFLMRGIKYSERTERKEKWLSLVGEDVNGEGYNSFCYSVIVGGEKNNFYELHSASAERERPLSSMPRYYTAENNVMESFQLLNIISGNIILTSVSKQEDGYLLRFFEPDGIDTNAQLIINLPFSEAYISDFSGKHRRDVAENGNIISFGVKKHEIVTLKLIKA